MRLWAIACAVGLAYCGCDSSKGRFMVSDGLSAAADAHVKDPVPAGPHCITEALCAGPQDCPASTRCNLALPLPVCQQIYCGAEGTICSEDAHCSVGLACSTGGCALGDGRQGRGRSVDASSDGDAPSDDGVGDIGLSEHGDMVGSTDTAKDTVPTPDSELPDVPPMDDSVADGATDTPVGEDTQGAEPVDIVVGDVTFPSTCEVDEDCVPSGPLPECVVGRCIDGACSPGAVSDGEPCDAPGQEPTACVVEQCKAARCHLVELGVGQPCGVTDACFEDRCNAAGLCVAVSVVSCDDKNPCTADSCDPITGCKSVAQIGANCDDKDNCTQKDSCLGDGTCAGIPVECPADPCHKAACDPETGTCVQTPDVGALCDDGDKCTTFDKCTSSGVCAGSFKCAKPSNPCHKAVCSPVDGTCLPTPAEGQPCNDGNACTVPDVCQCPVGAVCTLSAIQCAGQVVPIGRPCESIEDCAYPGAACSKAGVCVVMCDSPNDCPEPPANQGTPVCEPVGTPAINTCGIVKCVTSVGKPGQCIDGACHP